MAAPAVGSRDDYLGEHHVYTPHRAGVPPIPTYFRELWRRRQFVLELAQAELKAQNYSTALGQLWLVLSPLLNAAVYFVLVTIINPRRNDDPSFLPHLLGGIFAYTFLQGVISQSAGSVVGGGKLILNTAFPRLLLPVTQVVVAFFRFLPTVPVLALVVIFTLRDQAGWSALLAVPVFLLIVLTAAGLGFLAATLQVYFRDFKNLLPYILRLGLYLTPILYFAKDVGQGNRSLLLTLNPLAPVFRLWSDVIVLGSPGTWGLWAAAAAWALGFFAVGGLLFMSREREFAVRI